jgi:hypothetical protein
LPICAYRTHNRPRPASILHATNCGEMRADRDVTWSCRR